MPIAGISQGLGLGGGTTATISGAPSGGIPYADDEWSSNFDGADALANAAGPTMAADGTMSFWMYNGEGGATLQGMVLSKGYALVGRFNNWGVFTNSGTSLFVISGQQTATTAKTWSSAISKAAWHHVVLALDYTDATTSSITAYVDGSALSGAFAVSGATFADVSTGIRAGSYHNGVSYSYGFTGYLNELALWDTTLDAAAVSELYNSAGGRSAGATNLREDTGNYSAAGNLVGWWRMGDSDSPVAAAAISTITDEVNSNDLTQSTGSLQPEFIKNVA
tara:strand:- start:776 stop:1612 length:837 start_codon:yes stop_codon:yes gene_type:complete